MTIVNMRVQAHVRVQANKNNFKNCMQKKLPKEWLKWTWMWYMFKEENGVGKLNQLMSRPGSDLARLLFYFYLFIYSIFFPYELLGICVKLLSHMWVCQRFIYCELAHD